MSIIADYNTNIKYMISHYFTSNNITTLNEEEIDDLDSLIKTSIDKMYSELNKEFKKYGKTLEVYFKSGYNERVDIEASADIIDMATIEYDKYIYYAQGLSNFVNKYISNYGSKYPYLETYQNSYHTAKSIINSVEYNLEKLNEAYEYQVGLMNEYKKDFDKLMKALDENDIDIYLD